MNGKKWLSLLDFIEVEFGVPKDELEAIAKKYRPMLESLGILEDLHSYQEVMLFVWLWKHDKEIKDAAKGVCDIHVEWSDS